MKVCSCVCKLDVLFLQSHAHVCFISKPADSHMHSVIVAAVVGVCMPHSQYEVSFILLKAQS